MHIYSAQMLARPGKGAELGELVTQVRDLMGRLGVEASAWAAVSGAPLGMFGLSTRLEGTQDLVDLQMKLAEASDYAKLALSADGIMVAPGETALNQVVHATGETDSVAPYIMITRATIAGGQVGKAMAWGVEILEYAYKVGGLGGMFASSAAGNFLDVSWIGFAESAAELDKANDAIQADTGYMEKIDQAGGLFVDESAHRMTLMRLP